MRILMRDTVFKTAALAGLFSCMLMLAGAFSGITTSVHAIHADEVETREQLKLFVQEAIDEYYIKTIIKTCDFSDAPFGPAIEAAGLDLATATVDAIKRVIPLFPAVGLTGRSDIAPYCDFSQRFAEVFGYEDGPWKSGSVYLFVMDDTGTMLYHGDDPEVAEGMRVVAVDDGGRNVRDLILNGADASPKKEGSFVKYCWEDPAVDGDEIDGNDRTVAPGDSLKITYVVNPFEYLEAPALSASPGVIFGSGIYPEMMDSELPECDGNGMADGGEQMMEEEMEETMEEEMEEEMEEMEEAEEVEDVVEEAVDSVSGGGCAIAAGSDSTPRNNAFNLLLIVSALFFTVSFGNRAVGRRNGSSS